MIPYGRQDITPADIAAVTAVLESDWLTQGPAVPRFEAALSARCGARHAVAMNSATSALHVACLALDLGPGDLLWTSPITFVASANCARYCGAEVDFVDIDPATLNMSPVALAAKLERARAAGRLPKIVVPVHFGGQSCDMRAIGALAQQYGVRVIEDAAHAIGGRYDGAPIGGGRHADITILSFHPVKIITTGEGGAALTNDPALARRMARLRSHGTTREPAEMAAAPEGLWCYEQLELGYNYRLTDLQAALGLSQLERIDAYLARRAALARRYGARLAALPLSTQRILSECASAWHLYVVCLDRHDRRRVYEGLRAAGIGANVHYIPVHLQPYYRALGFKPGDFPAAERYYRGALTLPLHARLSDAEQDRVIAALEEQLT